MHEDFPVAGGIFAFDFVSSVRSADSLEFKDFLDRVGREGLLKFSKRFEGFSGAEWVDVSGSLSDIVFVDFQRNTTEFICLVACAAARRYAGLF